MVWALDHHKPTPFRFGLNGYYSICGNIEKPAAAFKKQSSKIRIVVVGRWDSSRRVLHGETLRHRQSRPLQKYVMLGNATIRNSRPHNWVSLAATDFRENDDVRKTSLHCSIEQQAISRSRAPHLTRLQQDRINFGNLGTVGFRDLTTCNVDLEI